MSPRGHSVLQVPVPALEPFVLGRTRFYDRDYASADPDFVHAHVTALGPWLPDPTKQDLAIVAEIAAATAPFTVVLDEVRAFEGGIIHLRPQPDLPFLGLTSRLLAVFPACVPYEGEFDVVPHLTLDHQSTDVSVASTRALLEGVLPVVVLVDRLDLAWYEPGGCRVLQRWSLGS